MRLLTKQSGFTLIEIIVVMVVTATMALVLANFIVTWLDQSTRAQNEANLLLTAESSLDTVTSDIKLSGSADDTNRWADANGPGGNQFGWDSGNQILVLAKAAFDNQGNIIFSDPAKYITLKDNEVYFLTGTTLYRRTLTSGQTGDEAKTTCPANAASPSCPADSVIATGVTSLSFNYYDANENIVIPSDARSVQASITLVTGQGKRTTSASYTTRMVFRNE